MKSRSVALPYAGQKPQKEPQSVIGGAPLQRLIAAWRKGQRLAARGLEPESGLSDKERLNELLELFDHEEINAAVDSLERPN